MSDQDGRRETDPSLSKSPPPAYSEVQGYSGNPQGPAPGGESGYPPQSYPQPYMQGYHHAPGQGAPEPADMKGSGYPPPGQYPPGVYPPPGQPGVPPMQPGYPPPGQPGYPPQAQPGYPPQGAYSQGPYGQPTTSVVVTQPSGATMVVTQGPQYPDNMLLSIIACLCCFCPTGIFAIMYSCQAKNANEANDYNSAMRYSQQAKKLAIASIIIGIVVMAIFAVLRLVVFTTNTTYSY